MLQRTFWHVAKKNTTGNNYVTITTPDQNRCTCLLIEMTKMNNDLFVLNLRTCSRKWVKCKSFFQYYYWWCVGEYKKWMRLCILGNLKRSCLMWNSHFKVENILCPVSIKKDIFKMFIQSKSCFSLCYTR